MASLAELMKQVPLINTKLKRNIKRGEVQEEGQGHGRLHGGDRRHRPGLDGRTSATKKPDQVKQWYGFSAAMRDDAGAVNAAIHKGDEPAAAKAMKKLAQSCDDCHDVFHKEAK